MGKESWFSWMKPGESEAGQEKKKNIEPEMGSGLVDRLASEIPEPTKKPIEMRPKGKPADPEIPEGEKAA